MPIYTYECTKCQKEEDRIVRMDDRENQLCEACGQRLQQLLTTTLLNVETVPGYGKRYTS